jgi:hypothetical protein
VSVLTFVAWRCLQLRRVWQINGFGPVAATEVTHLFGMFWVSAVLSFWAFVGWAAASDVVWSKMGGTPVPVARQPDAVARPSDDDDDDDDGGGGGKEEEQQAEGKQLPAAALTAAP